MTTKTEYCSTCLWFPKWFRDWYEKHAHEACHNHDKAIGINGTVSKQEADREFLYDLIELSTFPPVIKHIIAIISYWVVCMRPDPWPEGFCHCQYNSVVKNKAGKFFCAKCHKAIK